MYIKISHITNLQDARYCAAMGFQFISFSLLSRNSDSLSAQQIREIAAWLSGTQYVLACDEASVATLQAIHPTFPYHYIEIPQADWGVFSFLPAIPVIIKANPSIDLITLETLIKDVQKHHQDAKVEISLELETDYLKYEPYFPSLFLHINTLESLSNILQHQKNLPFGFSLRNEALEEDGGLDYEKLDNLCELINKVG